MLEALQHLICMLTRSPDQQLALASAARTEIVLTTDGDMSALPDEDDESDEALRRKAGRLKGPSKDAQDLFTAHVLPFETDETKEAGTRNAQLKLLMRLLNWESSEGTLVCSSEQDVNHF